MEISPTYLFPIIVILPLTLVLGFLYVFRWLSYRNHVLPFDIAEMERMPGHGLLSQHNDCLWQIALALVGSMASVCIPLSVVGFNYYFGKAQPSIYTIILLALVTFLVSFFYLFKAITQLKNLRAGLEAEWAVGNQLNQLQMMGYNVFHDIQADNFNIDHLVIGRNGVFAVETKSRRKPLTGKQKAKQFNVQVKGSLLEFPTWQDTKIIEQASRQSNWVASWLSHSTGERVYSKPVVVLPGWYVEYKEKPTVSVLALKNIVKTFPMLPGNTLSDTQIERIIYQIKQRIKRGNDLL